MSRRPAGVCGAIVALALTTAGPARAYDLSDPVPADKLSALCTDRPTKSTSPCTVDAGHVQIESDLFNVTEDRGGGLTTITWLATNPTVKVGLTDTLDVEANLAPYVSVLVKDRATGERSHASGVGDLFLRAKWNVLGARGGAISLALSPYLKLPTARSSIGNGAVEGGLIAPINVDLPAGFSVVIDPEVDILRNAGGEGRHVNVSGLLSLSRGLGPAFTASAEIWTDTDFDPQGSRAQMSADLGLAYIPPKAPNWQVDGGVNFGLNRRTPSAQAYVGLSRRF